MEILILLFVVLIVLSIVIAIFKKFGKHILATLFFIIPMAVAFPSLLIALFKVNIAFGIGVIVLAAIGWAVISKINKDYPTLEDGTNGVFGGFALLILLTATISGAVLGWGDAGSDGFEATVFLLVAPLYGGVSLGLLLGPLAAIPWGFALSIHKAMLAGRLKSAELDTALSLTGLGEKIGLKNTEWLWANLRRFTLAGGEKKEILPNYVQAHVGKKKFVIYDKEYIISSQGFEALRNTTENYLYQNGARKLEQLASEVTKNSDGHNFLSGVLYESIKNDIVEKVDTGALSAGADGEVGFNAGEERWLYMHKQSPNSMDHEEIDLDEEDN
jgi:hypothetical protein